MINKLYCLIIYKKNVDCLLSLRSILVSPNTNNHYKLVKAHAIGVNHLLLSRGFMLKLAISIEQEQKANASSLCNYLVIP